MAVRLSEVGGMGGLDVTLYGRSILMLLRDHAYTGRLIRPSV